MRLSIDGSMGEGGGQILRSALSLSLVTRTPFRLHHIRARRARPGLMRQHLAAVRAAVTVGEAEVRGDFVGSTELEFAPRALVGGELGLDIGSAGSTTLVLQTILPALLGAGAPSTIALAGGTHNPLAPTCEFLARVFLPLLARMGARVDIALDRPGFYPAGGGRLRATVHPVGHPVGPPVGHGAGQTGGRARLGRLDLLERGAVRARRARALVSALPASIGERELAVVRRRLDFEHAWCQVEEVADPAGPGNLVEVEIESEQVTELFVAFGEKGVRAELVAERAAAQADEYLAAGVPVGEHLADQLLLPMALAGGGSFRTTRPTPHTETQAVVIAEFLGTAVRMEPIGPCGPSGHGRWHVEVG